MTDDYSAAVVVACAKLLAQHIHRDKANDWRAIIHELIDGECVALAFHDLIFNIDPDEVPLMSRMDDVGRESVMTEWLLKELGHD